MGNDEFAAWCQRYCSAFSRNPQEAIGQLSEWRASFDRSGYSTRECNEALTILIDNPPKGIFAHPEALKKCLASARQRIRQAIEYRKEEMGDCFECKSTGYITVPHSKAYDAVGRIKPGLWYYDAAVYCRCALGQWKANQCKGNLPTMTIEQYEAKWPTWKDVVWEWEQQKKKDEPPHGPNPLAAVLERIKRNVAHNMVN